MSKTSFGKLAIGVVALSGSTVAQAEGLIKNFFEGTRAGVYGILVGGVGENNSWPKKYFDARQVLNGAIRMEHGKKAYLGPVSFNWSAELGGIAGAETLSNYANALSENTKKLGESTGENAPVVTQDPARPAKKDTRKADAIAGVQISPLGVTGTYRISHAVDVKVSGLLGGVIPTSNYRDPYLALTGKLNATYRFLPSWNVELGGRYVGALDNAINSFVGLTFGVNHVG